MARGNKRSRSYSRSTTKKRVGPPDLQLIVVVGFLLVFGWVMVYSSSVIVAFSQDRTPWFYFLRQFIWIVLGIVSGFVIYKIDYKKLPKIAPAIMLTAIFALVFVLIAGVNINGSQRWIRFPFFDLQPSEFTKLAFIIYLASWLSRKRPKKFKNSFQDYFMVEMIPFLIVLGITLVLILLEPDLSTTSIIGIVALAMFYLSGNGRIHNIGFTVLIAFSAGVGLLAAGLESYRIKRVQTYLNVLKEGLPEDRFGAGYQLSQILIAVGSGGLTGLGFGQSKQKFNYLGETAFSDTIFAVIAEEFGFLGSLIIVSAFLYIGFRGLKIALNAPDKLSSLMAAGIVIWLTTQALLNIAANTGLIPLTGIPLPFISYGGSSMIVNLTAVGLLLNISKYAKLE